MHSIQIPKPCHESWQAMTPENNGRHCAQCSKTVIDFTEWAEDDIHRFMHQQGSAKICGRFREEQLLPSDTEHFIHSVSYSPLPLYKKVAAIFLFAFGMLQMSCNTDTPAQKPMQQATTKTTDTPEKKTENITMGAVAIPVVPLKQNTKPEHIIMGGIKATRQRKPEHIAMQADTAGSETYMKGEVTYKPIDTSGKRKPD